MINNIISQTYIYIRELMDLFEIMKNKTSKKVYGAEKLGINWKGLNGAFAE